MFKFIKGAFGTLSGAANSLAKGAIVDMIDIESIEDERTMSLNNGGLVTLISLDGAMKMFSRSDLEDIANRFRISLSPFMTLPGHGVEFFFSQDPASGAVSIDRIIERTKRTAASLGLDMDDLLSERSRHLSKFLVEERCLIALHTGPDVMNRDAVKRATEAVSKRLSQIPPAETGQTPGKIFDEVHSRHRALVDSLIEEFRRQGFVLDALLVPDALREIRAILRPDSSPYRSSWQPRMPVWAPASISGPGPAFISAPDTPSEMAGKDISPITAPTFDIQLADSDAIEVDPGIFRIGDHVLAAFDVTMFQEVLTPFDALVSRLSSSSRRFPWRVSVAIDPGGLQAVGTKAMFTSVFSWASPSNKRIKEAVDALREISGQVDTVVRTRISFTCWAPASDIDSLRDNLSSLRSAVQQWGNCQVDGLSGDPLDTIMSSVPAISRRSTAPVAAAPLSSSLAVCPLSRQASPWKFGSVIFRTSDGKVWPYQPGSSEQTTWVDIFTGTPGSGKSVTMNAINLASVLAGSAGGDQSTLPRVGIIDIGLSSSGLIDLIKGALPASRQHEAIYRRLRMVKEHAINPFDTQLGMREPLSSERQFLTNFLSVLCSDGQKSVSQAMAGLISATLDEAYQITSDRRDPKIYAPDDVPSVDRALAATGFSRMKDATITWWEVVDHLMEKNRTQEAFIAQRQAVPLLSDLVTASQSSQVQTMYGGARDSDTGQSLIQSFQRIISEVSRDFPILSQPTRFSISNARVISLDLEEVTARGVGSSAVRQTSMMYMLARYVLTRDYYLDETEFSVAVNKGVLPQIYEAWHVSRSRKMKQTPKRLCMDEFHRTGGVPGILDQVLQDIREGRKHNAQIAIASQLISDFSDEILQMASSVSICNAPGEKALTALRAAFSTSPVEEDIISRELNGPSRLGAPIFLISRVKSGVARQKIFLTLGPVELWALSTTSEDVALRRILYESIGPSRARSILASRFPAGTAKPEIEIRKTRLEEEGGRLDRTSETGIIESLGKELQDAALQRAS